MSNFKRTSLISFEALNLEVLVPQEGYILIYVSNEEEQANIAYFDDVSIEHNHSAVIQEESYYPFGMSQHYSYQRELSKEQRYTYNGKESITDLDLGWLDFGARMYQADLGRWFNVDPMAEKYYDMTPYKYGLNNPVAYTDPNGMTEVYGVEMDLGATGSVQNVFDVSSSDKGEEKKKGGCGGPGQPPCPNGMEQEIDLMPDDALSYLDVVPSAKDRVGVGKTASSSGDMNGAGVLKNVTDGANYASGAIGLTQIGMLEYRMALPLSSKIGTFSSFSSTYRGLGVASKTLGRAGTYIGAPLSIGLDYSAYRSGEISGARFGYRTGSLSVSIGTGAAIGGPWGAAAGAAVGGISIGAEYIYDNMLVPLWNETNRQIYNFEKAIKNGWYPGR